MAETKYTVVLLNLGGPDSPEAVEPFLFNLFNDPEIIHLPGGRLLRPLLARFISRARAPRVREYYRKIGGEFPLLDITRQQARALQQAFGNPFAAEVKIAMRYWHPLTEETLLSIPEDHRVVLLPLYPQFSKTTTGSAFKEVQRIVKRQKWDAGRFSYIRDYHDHPGFIASWVELIYMTLQMVPIEDRKSVPIIFSAHSVPWREIQKGDPYQQQIERTAHLIMEKLGLRNPFVVAYQSKVGPVRWLEPSVFDAVRILAGGGARSLLVVPVSFVSEHSETFYELDIVLKEEAQRLGIRHYYRVPALNTLPSFIQTLKEVVIRHVEKN